MDARLELTDLDQVLLRAAHEGARLALAEHAEQATLWMGVKRAAAYLDTSEDGVRALVKRGQLPCHRTPVGRILFRTSELDEWAAGEVA
jgi:excisionase family DNA binding protein